MQDVTGFVNRNEIVKQIPFFSGLNWLELWMVLPKMSFFEYKKNEIVYKEGDACDTFYFLISGRIQLCRVLDSGQDQVLEHLTRGKHVSLVSLMTNEPHSEDAKVINDSFILKIAKSDFDSILKRIPKLSMYMNTYLSRRLRRRQANSKDISPTKIISISSAVGRIGKSMYAKNLSSSLKKETDKRVITLDMSLRETILEAMEFSQKILKLDLDQDGSNDVKIEQSIIAHACGIDFISISYNPDREQKNLKHLLNVLIDSYDYIVIDLPAGLRTVTRQVLAQSDFIHILTDKQKHNLRLTKGLVKELTKKVENISDCLFILINELKVAKTKIYLKKVRKLLESKIYAVIPHFQALQTEEKILLEVLECPQSEYARAVRGVAREIGEVRVGLVLSGGAAFGISHVGVLKVFEEEGIPVDVMSGCSMGAFLGTLWASGLSAKDIEKIALSFENKMRAFRLFDITFPWRGLIAGNYISRLLAKNLKVKTFRDLKIPVVLVACDLESREEVIFDEGDLVEAVRASIAIPGVFTPLRRKGSFLIDGGIVQPLPVQPLINMGVSKIIAVNAFPNKLDIKKSYQKYKERLAREAEVLKKSNFIKNILHRLGKKIHRMFFPNISDAIVIAFQTAESVLAEISAKQADICLHPDFSEVSWFEFYKSRELIKRGEEEARKLIPRIKEVLAGKNDSVV